MNSYISLGTSKNGAKYYKTPSKLWSPIIIKPATVRITLLGSLDATYCAADFYQWQGEIEGPITSPGTGYGTISELRAVLAVRGTVYFCDHYGTEYKVHLLGPFKEHSFSSKWDGATNQINVPVLIYSAGAWV